MKKGVELLEKLCLCFGPTSFEEPVEKAIREELSGTRAELYTDRMGNLTAHLKGPEGATRVMLCAHMDEVGFMITEIDDNGFLRFDHVGGIDTRVLCGRPVTIYNGEKYLPGVIAAKGIHLQSAEERKKVPDYDNMYIDIGADDREQAQALVQPGDLGTFQTPFATFGKDGAYIRSKALDDRLGCALLIEVLREVEQKELPLDLWFCFTVREEIGKSGALVTANRVDPDVAIVLETTAIADRPDVDVSSRVAKVGAGGVLSLLDRGTIYDRALVDFALETAKKHDIPAQIKRYVAGGNDAAHVQRSNSGTRCLALSAATRYLHAPISVAAVRDYEAMRDLVLAMLKDWKG
ncbi:MAG: M42 family metallopeptidase [Ruminococcaceae bacterium]|nr:M42 family metallopeptidase [Oscillospiraceae bacterium]